MKRIYIYMIIVATALSLSSCQIYDLVNNLFFFAWLGGDEHEIVDYTVSGYIYNNEAELKPIVKLPIYVYDKEEYVVYTDENGYYEFRNSEGNSFIHILTYSLVDNESLRCNDERCKDSRIYFRYCNTSEPEKIKDQIIYVNQQSKIEVEMSTSVEKDFIRIRAKAPFTSSDTSSNDSVWLWKITDNYEFIRLYSDKRDIHYDGCLMRLPKEMVSAGYYAIKINIYNENMSSMTFQRLIKIEESDLNSEFVNL